MAPSSQGETGVILQMQDYSIHDGAGVRTTLFLAGCGLRCQWCANPESWTRHSKIAYYAHKCKGCQSCVSVCPAQVDPRRVDANRQPCRQCDLCVKACPFRALSKACTPASVEDVYRKIQRDALFFRYTEGGVTFSGGEPFLQHQFIRSLMDRCDVLGVTYWAETCGYFSWSAVKDLLPRFEHLFFDLKLMDSTLHEQYTGVGNAQILANVRRIHQLGIPLTIRMPFIPEVNGSDDNIVHTAQFMAEYLPGCRIELLPYHELGKAKYTAFNMLAAFHSFSIPTPAALAHAYSLFASYGVVAV
jgi:pyruvate formate lyase activating enzyme